MSEVNATEAFEHGIPVPCQGKGTLCSRNAEFKVNFTTTDTHSVTQAWGDKFLCRHCAYELEFIEDA